MCCVLLWEVECFSSRNRPIVCIFGFFIYDWESSNSTQRTGGKWDPCLFKTWTSQQSDASTSSVSPIRRMKGPSRIQGVWRSGSTPLGLTSITHRLMSPKSTFHGDTGGALKCAAAYKSLIYGAVGDVCGAVRVHFGYKLRLCIKVDTETGRSHLQFAFFCAWSVNMLLNKSL